MQPMLVWLMVTSLLAGVGGYSHFREHIPNGRNVPHPCVEGSLWDGVGHWNQAGGGERNPFGLDFARNGKKWDSCLCETDSDGDGRTNGEELGDPDCEWSVGEAPSTTEGLSHPGICEPTESAECQEKNQWEIECVQPGLQCEYLADTEDRLNKTLRISQVEIPAQVTTYFCQVVEFPDEQDYHIIAVEPELDNVEVIHHAILYGCPENAVEDAKNKFTDPGECTMFSHRCRSMLLIWTVGYYGSCLRPDFGIRIGPDGFKYAILETHYNNPDAKAGYEDASGLTIHYTPTLRPNDGSALLASPYYMALPPYQSDVTFDGGCPRECTEEMMQEAIHVTEIVPHMHFLGRRQVVEHRRNNTLIQVLLQEDNFDYNSPKPVFFDPPYVVEPGDEIYVRCHYDTTGVDEFTYIGFGTQDEMCTPILMYYPQQDSIIDCFTNNEIGGCHRFVGIDKAPDCLNDINAFFHGPYDTILAQLGKSCDPKGVECWPGCQDVIKNVSQHPCLQEGVDHVVLDRILTRDYPEDFIRMFASCDHATQTRQAVEALAPQTAAEEENPLVCELRETNSGWQAKPGLILVLMVVAFGSFL